MPKACNHGVPLMGVSEPLQTQACEDRDFSEWHGGCPWCAVWVVRVDGTKVQALMDPLRTAIQPWLLPRYERQPHVTVAYRGLMVDAHPLHACPTAVFGTAQLGADIAALQAAGLVPFSLMLQGAGSFSTVPYLAVMASAPLQQAHDAVLASELYPGWSYVPHLTLGHYACQVPMEVVLQQLQACAAKTAALPVSVDALWLARYRTNDIAGALHFEGRFDLRTQIYHTEPGALMVL